LKFRSKNLIETRKSLRSICDLWEISCLGTNSFQNRCRQSKNTFWGTISIWRKKSLRRKNHVNWYIFSKFSRFCINTHIHRHLSLRVPWKSLSRTSAHISLLRVLGNRDSAWETHCLLDGLDRILMKIFDFSCLFSK